MNISEFETALDFHNGEFSSADELEQSEIYDDFANRVSATLGRPLLNDEYSFTVQELHDYGWTVLEVCHELEKGY